MQDIVFKLVPMLQGGEYFFTVYKTVEVLTFYYAVTSTDDRRGNSHVLW